ncbi:VQ motif-containing protein 4-like [Abrus precatorius]|uniref:VQ motif-containing protein 4-like n=1 Tax=Abrus precatorius TaxID=3816 RepID=A0A8B8K5Z9_ABRPR|nr:VQ motif-containing protein 4-like [Abrus precatorius]
MDSMSPRPQENQKVVPATHSNGLHSQTQPPKPTTRSEPGNPYPTTFVQADTCSFKQVVQMLTGSSETAKQASCSKPINPTHSIPPIKSIPKKQQSGFKLYERRNTLKNLNINPLIPLFSSNRKPDILSPSILDFPALALSPVTPLIPDPFDRSTTPGSNTASPSLDAEAEAKAIKEKGFFLHPSPASTPRDAEPRLLPLFPTTSPRASGSSSSSSSAAS